MRRKLAVLAALCAALTLAGPSSALDVGVTEDEGNTNPSFVYATLQDLGMTTNVMSIRWNPLDPLGLPANFQDIKGAASVAAAHGVSIILATYQEKNTGITDTPDAPAVFAQWLQKVAQECPLCARKVIVLNEPNLQFFFKPTFDGSCMPASPAAYAEVLAAGYDALKAVDPTIRVYGLGLSPRGNDNCNAVSNVSMSPVSFLAELGKAYKAMGRNAPLMDALSFHPYPNANNQGPEVGYLWPNVGVPNLDRLKQVFHDAFAGTAQPVIGVSSTVRTTSAVLAPINIALDELGYQVDTQGGAGYTESENVPSISEATQAEWYADVIARYACDPSVETINFFHLRDEFDRRRFQSGLVRLDGSKRPSYDAVKGAIAQNKTCQGTPVSWRPAKTVIGAKALWPRGKKFSKKQSGFRFQLTAEERATYEAELVAASAGTPTKGKGKDKGKGKGKKPSATAKPLASVTGELRAYFRPFVVFKGKLAPGTYMFKVTVVAAMNPSRTSTFTSPAFTVK
ncbi:MAG: hypothetical protein WD249_04810 [Gaiellaceae bacterium]